MVKTTAATQIVVEKREAATVVKKKFTVAANGKKVPAPGTIAKPPAQPVKKAVVPAKAAA